MSKTIQAKSGAEEIKSEAKYAIIMAGADSVAIAIADLIAGDRVRIRSLLQEIVGEFEVSDSVPYGHKLAVKPLAKDSDIIKSGEVIGGASQAIRRGEHVHIHNVVSLYAPPPGVKSSRGGRKS